MSSANITKCTRCGGTTRYRMTTAGGYGYAHEDGTSAEFCYAEVCDSDDCDDHATGHTTSVNRGPLGHTPTGRRVPTFIAECLAVRCSWNVDGFFDRQSAIAAADAHQTSTRHACVSCGAA